jgi:hypothetical protein
VAESNLPPSIIQTMIASAKKGVRQRLVITRVSLAQRWGAKPTKMQNDRKNQNIPDGVVFIGRCSKNNTHTFKRFVRKNA